MKLNYYKAESTNKPEELEITSTTVYFRRNIQEESRVINEDNDVIVIYIYEEAKMSLAEYTSYSAVLNAQNTINTPIVQQEELSNQIIIMEAIAELYEMIKGGIQ